MAKEKSSSSSSIGFCGLLTIVFITLKLLEKITWSWGWVLSPIWLPIVAVLLIISVFSIVLKVIEFFANIKIKNKRRGIK